jgi:hypothetical protein
MSDGPENDKPGRGDDPSVVVWHGEESVDGDPIEPEEQLAEVVQPVKALVTLGHGPMREDVPLASLPQEVQELMRNKMAHIAHQTSAGELARSVLQRCQNCEHFDPVGWAGFIRRANASSDNRLWQALNEIRGELAAQLGLDPTLSDPHDLDQSGNIDLEHALKALGLCKALSEHFKDDIIVMPINPCAMPDFFKAKPGAKRSAASGYDWILRRAQGRPQ